MSRCLGIGRNVGYMNDVGLSDHFGGEVFPELLHCLIVSFQLRWSHLRCRLVVPVWIQNNIGDAATPQQFDFGVDLLFGEPIYCPFSPGTLRRYLIFACLVLARSARSIPTFCGSETLIPQMAAMSCFPAREQCRPRFPEDSA